MALLGSERVGHYDRPFQHDALVWQTNRQTKCCCTYQVTNTCTALHRLRCAY